MEGLSFTATGGWLTTVIATGAEASASGPYDAAVHIGGNVSASATSIGNTATIIHYSGSN